MMCHSDNRSNVAVKRAIVTRALPTTFLIATTLTLTGWSGAQAQAPQKPKTSGGVKPDAATAPSLQIAFGERGLSSLRYGGTEFLADGDFQVAGVALKSPDDEQHSGDLKNQLRVDVPNKRVTHIYSWGETDCIYRAQGTRLDLTVHVKNTGAQTIYAIVLPLMSIRFPEKPAGTFGLYPQHSHNLGGPTIITADYGSGVLVACNEEVTRPLLFGFPHWLDGAEAKVYSLQVGTSNNGWLSPYLDGRLDRPIPPASSDTFHLSLRFGPRGASAQSLAGDVNRKFAAAFPFRLKWADRRPMANVFLSTSEPEYHSPTNPRGWFMDPKGVDITTDAGRVAFKMRLMQKADDVIRVCKRMNAQGVVVWDIEGQQYPHATSYLGDPRSLPPEMDAVADEFFKRFTDAGLRVGVTLRPQQPLRLAYEDYVRQIEFSFPGASDQLMQKVAYAKKRWNCTLFYVDSNGDPNVPYDALMFQRVAQANPDVLLMPEHENLRYHATTAPYRAFFQHGETSTPEWVRDVYPDAFSVIYAPEGDFEHKRKELVQAVKRGDILMFHGWYESATLDTIQGIYREAGR